MTIKIIQKQSQRWKIKGYAVKRNVKYVTYDMLFEYFSEQDWINVQSLYYAKYN